MDRLIESRRFVQLNNLPLPKPISTRDLRYDDRFPTFKNKIQEPEPEPEPPPPPPPPQKIEKSITEKKLIRIDKKMDYVLNTNLNLSKLKFNINKMKQMISTQKKRQKNKSIDDLIKDANSISFKCKV